MKKLMSLLIVFLIMYAKTSHAQTNQKESLLWEITGNGLQQPSYLFGTIHIICKDDFLMSDTIRNKFNRADEIYLEMDMDDPSMQSKMMQLMKLPEGETLEQLFGPDYALADSFFKAKTGFPIRMFNQFKPMMLQSLLYQTILPCGRPESYEMYFVNMAQTAGKSVNGLETLEAQIAVFDAIPDQQEIKWLLEWVRQYDKQQAEFNKMLGYYTKQELTQLFDFMRSSPEMSGYEEILLNKRNRNWIPVMEQAMQNKSAFFAVGAGHLPGSSGVIALLRKKGFRVKPVQF
jgi:uncharacterized protein YbaP (TraB family)